MPTKLLNRETGTRDLVEDADLPIALASGKYVAPDAVAVHTLGDDKYTTPAQLQQGAAYTTPIDPGIVAAEQGHQIRQDANTGVLATGKAFVGGVAGGLTAGAFNPFEDAQEFNSVASGLGTAAGIIAPALLGDEAGVAGAAAALDPLAAERAAGTLSSKLLYAGEVGGEANSAAKLAEKGLLRSGDALADATTQAAVHPDLAAMGKPELNAAHEAELAGLDQARAPQRQQLATDLHAYNDTVQDSKSFLVTKDADVKGIGEIRQQAANNRKADIALRNAFNKGDAYLAENLRPVLGTLQQQEHALTTIYASEPELRATFAADESGERAAALDRIPQTLEQNRALQQRIRQVLVPKAELSSDRLTAIKNAKEALDIAPRAESAAEQMMSGGVFGVVTGLAHGIPVIGQIPGAASFLGAKAASMAGDLAFGRMASAVGEGIKRSSSAVDALLQTGAKKLTAAAPVLATKVLGSVVFAPRTDGERELHDKQTKLSDLYTQRSAELRSQVAIAPDGTPQMTPTARAAVAARLAPIQAHHPQMADMLETIAARRVEYLASVLPKRPDLGGMQTGPDRWHPSDMEMREFARRVAAVEDPGGVEERVAHGSVTPEDVDAYKAVYPERYAAFTQQVLERLPELRKQLPYQRRLALSIFTGTAVDPAMSPRILAVLQGQFANDPGSQGGTSAPKAIPQFGSVKAPDPTRSQKGYR